MFIDVVGRMTQQFPRYADDIPDDTRAVVGQDFCTRKIE